MKNKPTPLERKIIAGPEDYIPLSEQCKVIGAFNPGATLIKNEQGDLETLLMIRVAEEVPNKKLSLPFFEIRNEKNLKKFEINFDEPSEKEINKHDKNFVELKKGTNRLRHISLPRLMKLNSNGEIIEKNQEPCLYPSWEFERFGIEDVRITSMKNDKHILTYVCPHREFGVSTAFKITKDFKTFEEVIKENTPRPIFSGIKDIVIFPEKTSSPSETEILKKESELYTALIRPNAFSDISTPGIWISYSPDLVHWGQEHRLTISKEGEITGTGTPPIKIENKWIAAYHKTTKNQKKESVYSTKLMKMNLKEPWKEFKSSETLLERNDYLYLLQKNGYIPNVVFTSAKTEQDGITTLYSGIDDTWTVMDKFYTEDLLKFIERS
jgi:predicted GH43/DUF377 family glycosyl hydrolase